MEPSQACSRKPKHGDVYKVTFSSFRPAQWRGLDGMAAGEGGKLVGGHQDVAHLFGVPLGSIAIAGVLGDAVAMAALRLELLAQPASVRRSSPLAGS